MKQRATAPSSTRAQKRHLRERDRLRKKFGATYDALTRILYEYDPVGIAAFVPPDEYDLEVHAILGRVDEIVSKEALRRVLVGEFDRYFSPMDTDIRECAAGIAADFWQQIKPFAHRG